MHPIQALWLDSHARKKSLIDLFLTTKGSSMPLVVISIAASLLEEKPEV